MGIMSEDQMSFDRYILQKDIPGCKAGALFIHDKDDRVKGTIAEGCLKLAWTDDGSTQPETKTDTTVGLCAETIIFHPSVIRNEEWFVKESKHNRSQFKQTLIDKVEDLLHFLRSEK